jgi:hypothetical protein
MTRTLYRSLIRLRNLSTDVAPATSFRGRLPLVYVNVFERPSYWSML